jgi:hypothetical protein
MGWNDGKVCGASFTSVVTKSGSASNVEIMKTGNRNGPASPEVSQAEIEMPQEGVKSLGAVP